MYNSYSKLTKEQVINDIKLKKVSIYNLCKKYQEDKDIVIEFIKNSDENTSLFDLMNKWNDDLDVMFELVKKDMWALQMASERLKNNRKVVLEAVKKSGYSIRFANIELKSDIEIVTEALKQNGLALQLIPIQLRESKVLVLEAVKQNPIALIWASKDLQNNKELLLILENVNISRWDFEERNWYVERMEILSSIREKELMESAITPNDKSTKRIKF